jgi:hypothetical protein
MEGVKNMPGQFYKTILQMLPGDNPYSNFIHTEYPKDITGGFEHPIMAEAIDKLSPQLIVEVGTWKGLSAIFSASLLKQKNLDSLVLCIDTWLGTVNNMLRSDDPIWGLKKYYRNGYPTLYYQFLANIMHSDLQDFILPLPTTSATGALWLTAKGLRADIIYIDGSDEEDVVNYWKLLKYGGIMVGDDWHLGSIGVICAVNRFSKETGIKYQVTGSSWFMQKLPS